MRPRLPIASALIAAGACALHCLPRAADWLELDRHAVASGQFWRLWTGHLVHFGAGHLLWDALVVLVFGAIFEADRSLAPRRRTVAWVLAAGAGVVSGAVLVLVDHLMVYRGLSGLASLLFVWWAVETLRRGRAAGDRLRARIGGVALTAFLGKVLIEVATGSALFAPANVEGFVPVPLAHAVGAVVALLAASLRPIDPLPSSVDLGQRPSAG